ncbi:hypothetical protein BG20_I2259, partial [Candidatus Nitrosarchaeum limnium BG20]
NIEHLMPKFVQHWMKLFFVPFFLTFVKNMLNCMHFGGIFEHS